MKSFLFITSFCIMLCGVTLTTKAQQQYQFGFLNYNKVLKNLPEYATAQNTIKELQKKYQEEASYNEEKFKKMFADYLQGQKGFPEQIMLKRQKELQIAMEQGINFRKDAQRLLDNAEAELIQPLQQKLDSVLCLIGKENGLLFIGNSDNHNFPFIHNASGLDITEVVLARLNGQIIPINTPKSIDATATEPSTTGTTTEAAGTTN